MNVKKLIALLLAAILCFSLAATACAEGLKTEGTGEVSVTVDVDDEDYDNTFIPCVDSIESFTSETLPYYNKDVEDVSDIEVWYINDNHDVPYLSLESIIAVLSDAYQDYDGFELTLSKLTDDWDILVLTRENGSYMDADFENNQLIFSDIDSFTAFPTSVDGLDIIEVTTNGADDNTLIGHSKMFYKNPDVVTISLEDYGIPMIYEDGTGYLPLQTIADLLISRLSCYLLYNGQAVLLTDMDGMTAPDPQPEDSSDETTEDGSAESESTESESAEAESAENGSAGTESSEPELTMYEIYYSAPQATKSDMLRTFTYNELCMALDHCYGLQEEHEITSFNHLFIQTGLSDELTSENALDTYTALSTLTFGYFADLHSGANAKSYMAVPDDTDPFGGLDANSMIYGIMGHILYDNIYSKYREEYYPDGCPGYEEVDDTAYITFDSFSIDNLQNDPDYDYYANEPTANLNDTIELLMYANDQIHRENSPIQNVVLDLTNNGGGAADTAVCVVAWMLGNCQLSMEDVISGAQSTVSYTFDANRDGQIDENDYLGYMNYNLYCLISPCSFSCGNLVPAALSANHFVTLIGDSSTGGACCVYPMSTADGTLFQVSGPYRVSTMNNGIYYSVDQGVNPDDYIDKLEHLYDREYLTDYIHNLA